MPEVYTIEHSTESTAPPTDAQSGDVELDFLSYTSGSLALELYYILDLDELPEFAALVEKNKLEPGLKETVGGPEGKFGEGETSLAFISAVDEYLEKKLGLTDEERSSLWSIDNYEERFGGAGYTAAANISLLTKRFKIEKSEVRILANGYSDDGRLIEGLESKGIATGGIDTEQRGTMTALWNITNNPNREIDDDRAALVWRNKIRSKFAEKMKEQMEELSSPVDFTVVASQSGDLETAKSIAENSIFTVFIPGSEELKQGQEMINAYMGGNLMSLNLKEANDLLDAVEGADKGDKSEKRTLKSAADAISRLFGEDGEQMNVLVTNGSKGSQISSRNGNESHYVEAYDPSVDFDAEDEESLPKAKYTLGAGDATATVTGFLLAYSNLSPEVAAAYGNKAGFMVCTHTENTLTPEQVLTLFPPTEEEVTVSGIQKAIKMRRSIEKLQAA